MNRFRINAGNIFTVYSFNKGHWETAFFAEENPDLFHNVNLVKCILKFQKPNDKKQITSKLKKSENCAGLAALAALAASNVVAYVHFGIWNLLFAILYLAICKLPTHPAFLVKMSLSILNTCTGM